MEHVKLLVWVISDFLILVATYYIAIIIFRIFIENTVKQIIAATIAVNILVPIIASNFDTPLMRVMNILNLTYFVPITVLSIIVFIGAFLFTKGKRIK